MVIIELFHLFSRVDGDPVYSPKALGLFVSRKSAEEAIQYYKTQPGFCDNPDAFSVRRREVQGELFSSTVFEALIYLHSADYEFETSIELGLFLEKKDAQNAVTRYCSENTSLIHARGVAVERIVNGRLIGRREWAEGFTASD